MIRQPVGKLRLVNLDYDEVLGAIGGKKISFILFEYLNPRHRLIFETQANRCGFPRPTGPCPSRLEPSLGILCAVTQYDSQSQACNA